MIGRYIQGWERKPGVREEAWLKKSTEMSKCSIFISYSIRWKILEIWVNATEVEFGLRI